VIVVDVVAFVATAWIIGTYLLTATHRVSLLHFHRANFVGGMCTGASAWLHQAYPSLVLTAAFATIGLVGIIGWQPDA